MTAVDPETKPVAQATAAKRPASGTTSIDKVSIWERIPRWISIPGFILALLLAWQIAVELELLSPFVLPPVMDVWDALYSQVTSIFTGGPVLTSLWITVQEAALGLVLAMIIGIGLGVITAETAFGRNVLMPVVVAINAAPKVAFAPIFVAWLGFGISSKVALAAFIAFFPLLIDTAAGLAGVDREQLKLFQSIRASRTTTFIQLKLPSALPYIFAGLKTASVLAVVGAVVGEFLGGGAGLGQDLRVAGNRLAIDRVWGYAIILSVVGYFFYWVVTVFERKIVFWRRPLGVGDL